MFVGLDMVEIDIAETDGDRVGESEGDGVDPEGEEDDG